METIKRLIPLFCVTVLLLGVYWWQGRKTESPAESVTTAPVTQTTEPASQAPTTEPVTLPTDVPISVPTEPAGEWLTGNIYSELKAYFYQKSSESGEVPVNYFNRILWADFETPEDVELWSLFFDQDVDENQDLTKAERAFLEGREKEYVVRISSQKMDAVLQQCVGLTLEQTNKNGLEQLRYFEETDCYYIPLEIVQKDRPCDVNFRRGWVLEDGKYLLEYEILDANDWFKHITLEKTEEGIRVLSNVTLPRQAENPFLIKQEIKGSYYSRDSQLFIYTPWHRYGDWGPEGWKRVMYRCVMRHKLQEGALYEYCESTDSIRLITEGPVKEQVQTREDYFYILRDAPDRIIRQNRETGEESVIFTSTQGDIECLRYYGFEEDGELIFTTGKSCIYALHLPEQEAVLIYEDPGDIDAIVTYNRENCVVEFRDMRWMFWDYYIKTGELKGPFE